MRTGKKKIIYIEFEDHCTGNSGWTKINDCYHNICSAICVGFLVRESKKYLTLSILGQPGNDVFSNTMTIVKSCITKRKTLKGDK